MTELVTCFRPISFEVLDDEALVFLYQNAAVERAKGILAERHLDSVYQYLQSRIRGHFLKAPDREDARQSAVLWFVEAIQSFDPRRPDLTFGTHWQLVVRLRLVDWIRRLRRDERHVDRSADAGTWLDIAPEHVLGRAWGDPADELVAWEDSVRHAKQALGERSNVEQRLWHLLAEGDALFAVARKLGISYDAARRCRQRLVAELALRLHRDW